MARFDVFPNPDAAERKRIPYFLDVQNNHIKGIQTRVVVPLWWSKLLPTQLEELNPEFNIDGASVVMDTPSIGAAPLLLLRKPVTNLVAHQLVIQNSLDTLFGGY